MPEEINRILTDQISDLLFVTEDDALEHLQREGIDSAKVHLVGNCMVDTLLRHVKTALNARPWERFQLGPKDYALLTLHRPSNVNEDHALRSLIATLNRVAERLPLVFPVHPRTRARITSAGIPIAHRCSFATRCPTSRFSA